MSEEIKIHILCCGNITVAKSAVFGKSFHFPASHALTSMHDRVCLPVFSFLIEHPKGLVLVDTGLSRDVSPEGVFSLGDAAGVMTAPIAGFFHPVLPSDEAIDRQLAELSIKPSDLSCVLLTHLDADHVCGLRHLDGAQRILCSQEDYWWSCRNAYSFRQPKRLWLSSRLDTFWYKGTDLGPSIWSYDYFGDGSMILVHLPGHTDGQFGVLLSREGRFVLLTADAAFNSSSWEKLRVPGFGFNPKAQLKCLQWIQEKSRDPGCVAVLASHDPALVPSCVVL